MWACGRRPRTSSNRTCTRLSEDLKEVVHFYTTRDVFPFNVTVGNCPAGKTEKVDCWPMPEVPGTKDMTIGKLGLTDQEENQIVALLMNRNACQFWSMLQTAAA
jgi:hypothetical protein